MCVNTSNVDTPLQVGDIINDNYRESLIAYTLHTSEPTICEDIADEPRFKSLPAVVKAGYGSSVGISIVGNNKTEYGVLAIYSKETRDFSYDEVYFLQSIANVLGTFIERNRAQLVAGEQAEFAEALRDATAAINSRLDLPDVLAKIMSYLRQVVPQTRQASIMLRNDETGRYYHHTTWGFADDTPEATAGYAFALADFPFLRLMVETGKPINVSDVQSDVRWIMRDTVNKTRSYLAAPIIVGDETIGFINLYGYTNAAFSEEDTTRLKTFSETVSTAIVNAQKQEDLERKVLQRNPRTQSAEQAIIHNSFGYRRREFSIPRICTSLSSMKPCAK